jgi:hypothetical protein
MGNCTPARLLGPLFCCLFETRDISIIGNSFITVILKKISCSESLTLWQRTFFQEIWVQDPCCRLKGHFGASSKGSRPFCFLFLALLKNKWIRKDNKTQSIYYPSICPSLLPFSVYGTELFIDARRQTRNVDKLLGKKKMTFFSLFSLHKNVMQPFFEV